MKTLMIACFLFATCQLNAQLHAQVTIEPLTENIPTITTKEKRFTARQMMAPSVFIASGIAAAIKWPSNSFDYRMCSKRNKDYQHFKTDIDDYLQFSPVVLTYGLDALGMKCRTDFLNRTAICLKSHLLMTGIVTSAKLIINNERPDKTGNNSFPSGHTAQAFVAATFMSEELGHRYKWMPYVAYTLASSVGACRVMNNKHYVSDVLVGAGVGILATKLVYATHKYKWGKKKEKIIKLGLI